MIDYVAVWKEVLPDIRNSVTGVGIWQALNSAVPVAFEDGTFVIGLPHAANDLSGHLRVPVTRTIIEKKLAARFQRPIVFRVIDGVTLNDWESAKRRDQEVKRLEEQAMARLKAETDARSGWDTVYEQLSRKHASISNRSLPQNRALFFLEAVDLIAQAYQQQEKRDDLSERNFARCIERVAQYSDIPSPIVALRVLEKLGQA